MYLNAAVALDVWSGWHAWTRWALCITQRPLEHWALGLLADAKYCATVLEDPSVAIPDRVGTIGQWGRRKLCLLKLSNQASHAVAQSCCWVVRSSCHNCNMYLIKTRCILFFWHWWFSAMTELIPRTPALGEKGLRDTNKDGQCLLSMFKASWKMTGTKEGTTSLDHTQSRRAGSLPGRNND